MGKWVLRYAAFSLMVALSSIRLRTIRADRHRPHGVRYRLAWIQSDQCRVLFDNHHGKADYYHVDGKEYGYTFRTVDALFDDFLALVKKLGGAV